MARTPALGCGGGGLVTLLAKLRVLALWLLAERPVLGAVLPHGTALELRVVVVVWQVVAGRQAAVPEVEPVWAAWAAQTLVR
ncbi:hypothetical protein ABZ078_24185 [Streptomyces sp. NPDC006385]|uniref:hypothetical protein n=1 Tax=Streptomyces sp. NPDC006385 TaxID=3156761 RepID=UPI0033B5105E